jgi:hypothetical protein
MIVVIIVVLILQWRLTKVKNVEFLSFYVRNKEEQAIDIKGKVCDWAVVKSSKMSHYDTRFNINMNIEAE